MNILQTKYNLPEHKLGVVLLQLSSSSDICEQIATSTNFHDVDDVTFCFEALIQSHYILLSSSFEYIVLLHNLFQRRLILHHLLTYALKGYEFTCQPMNGKIDLAKCSLTNYFSNFIIFGLRLKQFLQLFSLFIWAYHQILR